MHFTFLTLIFFTCYRETHHNFSDLCNLILGRGKDNEPFLDSSRLAISLNPANVSKRESIVLDLTTVMTAKEHLYLGFCT